MADERSRRYTMSACYQNDKIQLFLSMERNFNFIWMKLKWQIPILLFKEYLNFTLYVLSQAMFRGI